MDLAKRKRGRPPKYFKPEPTKELPNILRLKKRPGRLDPYGIATKEHILYCRIKLQKILLRAQVKVPFYPAYLVSRVN